MDRQWTLESVEVAARQASDTFFIPSRLERENQKAGDSVRLHFVLLNPPGRRASRRTDVGYCHPSLRPGRTLSGGIGEPACVHP